MSQEDQIKDFLKSALEKVKAAKKPGTSTYLWDIQARAENGTAGEIKYNLSAYVGDTNRLESDTLDGLIKVVQEYDPIEAARKSKQAQIEKLKSELAKLEETAP